MFSPILILVSFLAISSASPINPRAACSSDVTSLVNGINKNISLQKQEQGQVKVIQGELDTATPNKDDVESSASKLQDIINQSITVRENNQSIAPSGNEAISGLKTVQSSQTSELKIAKAITGDPTTDNSNLDKLNSMISSSISQNQQNVRDAAIGCTV